MDNVYVVQQMTAEESSFILGIFASFDAVIHDNSKFKNCNMKQSPNGNNVWILPNGIFCEEWPLCKETGE